MRTEKYTSHTIKTMDGKFVNGRLETELITNMVYSGKDSCMVKGSKVSVHSDKIETVEGKKIRVTVVDVDHMPYKAEVVL